jgi:hypothetical protein
VAAIKAAIAERPSPNEAVDKGLVFVTKYGRAWREDSSRNSPLSHEFAKLVDALKLARKGRNFYTLRRVLETIGGEVRDQPAVDAIMGHVAAASDMGAVYRQGVSDVRLAAVTDHVRAWLFPPAPRKRKAR